MELYPHKSGLGLIEPVAQINQNVGILWGKWSYYKVTYLEPIPPFQFLNLGAVALGTTGVVTAAPNLELFQMEFGQFRWYPVDNAQIRLWLPSADGRFRLKNIMSMVDQNILDRDPCLHLTEFFEWEDESPSFQATNGMDYALTQCRLIGFGYRFKVEPVDPATENAIIAGLKPCVRVVATGQSGSK